MTMSSELIQKIQANYRASLSDKLETLESLWSFKDDGQNELLAFLHQLAGSAGMYGYDQISDQCIALQSSLKQADTEDSLDQSYRELYSLIEQSING